MNLDAINHLIPGIRRYAEKHIRTGGFLEAVLSNDLDDTARRAGPETRPYIVDVVEYLRRSVPPECWGSRSRVDSWLAQRNAIPQGSNILDQIKEVRVMRRFLDPHNAGAFFKGMKIRIIADITSLENIAIMTIKGTHPRIGPTIIEFEEELPATVQKGHYLLFEGITKGE